MPDNGPIGALPFPAVDQSALPRASALLLPYAASQNARRLLQSESRESQNVLVELRSGRPEPKNVVRKNVRLGPKNVVRNNVPQAPKNALPVRRNVPPEQPYAGLRRLHLVL